MDIVLKDLNDHSRLVLTGDLKKEVAQLNKFAPIKAWIKIVDCTMAAKQANMH